MIEVRDSSLKELKSSYSKFKGNTKALVNEEFFSRSKSMETLSN